MPSPFLGSLKVLVAQKEYNCRNKECESKITAGERHAALFGRTRKKHIFFARRFHFQCLTSYMNWIVDNRDIHVKKGRIAALKLTDIETKQRASLLRLISYDKKVLKSIFDKGADDKRIQAAIALMLLHIYKLRSFGPYTLKTSIQLYAIVQSFFPDELKPPAVIDFNHNRNTFMANMEKVLTVHFGEQVTQWLQEEGWLSDGEVKMLPLTKRFNDEEEYPKNNEEEYLKLKEQP